ncbi:MAG: hypothetical protein Q9218_006391 [Villophora microphyllina]
MPSLSVTALPGVTIGVQDFHDLDISPTPTPAQTRSTSPVRGHHMPHSIQEATDFVVKLNVIVESAEPSDATKASNNFAANTSQNKLHPEYNTFPAVIQPDKQVLSSKSKEKNPVFETTPLTPIKSAMEHLTKVNAMDGSSNTSTASKVQILMVYFAFNLGLTLYNKAVMIQIMLARGAFTLKHLTNQDTAMLSAFSILYTANIAVSNVSLAMVTIPFHQTVRALTPVFTVAIYRIAFAGIYGTATYISLIPVIIGVMLASYGDLTATVVGFIITLFGTFLAAVKTVATNRLQTAGLHLSAFELLYRMSPIACLQSLFVAYITGEFERFDPRSFGTTGLLLLLGNGAIAFGLNVASFEANKRSGALTMTIAANIKQVLTIILAVVLWSLPVGVTNACGIGLTLLGGVLYGRVELMGSYCQTVPAEEIEMDLEVGYESDDEAE